MTISAVLLDLDDTLLESNMAQFIPAYLEKLAYALRVYANQEQIESAVRHGVAAIQNKPDRAKTNYQVFWETFVAMVPGPLPDIRQAIEQFYKDDYPTLQGCVQVRPLARALVTHLIETGYTVVIATNPLYPLTAIEQRLAWANVLDFPYAMITSQENMVAAKPALAYYEQILETIDVSPKEALMIGNDSFNDIAPTQELGLTTWWITDLAASNRLVQADFQGTLADCYRWVHNNGITQIDKSGYNAIY